MHDFSNVSFVCYVINEFYNNNNKKSISFNIKLYCFSVRDQTLHTTVDLEEAVGLRLDFLSAPLNTSHFT